MQIIEDYEGKYEGVKFAVTRDNEVLETIVFEKPLTKLMCYPRILAFQKKPLTDDIWKRMKDNIHTTREHCKTLEDVIYWYGEWHSVQINGQIFLLALNRPGLH
eukprot:TRINITY_DN3643_c0_g1_i10.p2 TRINITY_DN3643_c0_g1~~TRINITY_DN3643_c0_g1_i10.p2  ORF type:complete len:104 (+),score=0.31 TRINITY_DN3643_c0_g1_i10:733-1044(+)